MPPGVPKEARGTIITHPGATCCISADLTAQVSRSHFESFARAEFSRFKDVERRDFDAIEFLLRKGRRRLREYDSPGIKDIR
ncbi:hypothetical protein CP533_4596 [Ophiocordyceps camponoti-saundersi (nom. inval.)]|nr:hypothetical protein CP533_4596 [Ophiocordyceps camponoti-saundersi (nom. inval.)]